MGSKSESEESYELLKMSLSFTFPLHDSRYLRWLRSNFIDFYPCSVDFDSVVLAFGSIHFRILITMLVEPEPNLT